MGLESTQGNAHDSGPQEFRNIITGGRLDMRTSIQFSRTVTPDPARRGRADHQQAGAA